MYANKRKIVILAATIFIASYFARPLVTACLGMVNAMQAQRRQLKSSPFMPAPALPPPAFRGLLGNYNGKALLPRGLCALHFELRGDREHPGSFMAASFLGCTSPGRNRWVPRTNHVTSVVLSGSAATADIPFKITDTITADCKPTAFTAKPFGLTQLIIHWEDSCNGGTMIVNRQ
jgi:hypothetical protein